jgi:hypothetical protein
LGSLDSLDSSHPSLDPTFFSSFKNDLSEYATWESLCELAYEQKKFTLLESLPKTTGVAYYFHRKTPFHTERLLSLFEQWPISCIRTVGTLWLNSDIKTAFGISQFMNHQLFISEEGAWFIDQIKTHHHSYETFWDEYPELEQIWDTQLGDKRNEIVFIFDRQPSSHWMEALEKALLTEEELTVPLKRTSLDEPSSLKIETVTSEQKKQLESDRHNVIKIY